MTEAEERALVVAEARSWCGTPYRAGGDVKEAGVDCGMLAVRVFVDTGMLPPFDPRPYPEQWHVHQAEEKFLTWVLKHTHELPGPADTLEPGDVILYKYGRCFSHIAIVDHWPVVIHVRRPAPVVPEDASRAVFLRQLPQRFFSVWPRAV